ncbi:MAG: arsenate reductase ArsC [Pseudomonadota bacterium]
MNILVLCTGNSARSILLEYILRTQSGGRVHSFSAGSKPSGKVHPQSIRLLSGLGIDTSAARSKSWDVFGAADAPRMDVVITVCGSAAEEECPLWPAGPNGAPVRAHWGVEDPAAAPEPDWEAAFQTAYDILERRARTFLGQDILAMDQAALTRALNEAGQIP